MFRNNTNNGNNDNKAEGYDDVNLGITPDDSNEFQQLINWHLNEIEQDVDMLRLGRIADVDMLDVDQHAGNQAHTGDLLRNLGHNAAEAPSRAQAAELGAPELQPAHGLPQIGPYLTADASGTVKVPAFVHGQIPSPSSILPQGSLPGGGQMPQPPNDPNQDPFSLPEQELVEHLGITFSRSASSGQGNATSQAHQRQGAPQQQIEFDPEYGAFPPPGARRPPVMDPFGGFTKSFTQFAQSPFGNNQSGLSSQGAPMLGLRPLGPFDAQVPANSSPSTNNPSNASYPPNTNSSPSSDNSSDASYPPNANKIPHKRNRRGSDSNDPSKFYTAPVGLLGPWGPKAPTGKKGQDEHLFRYHRETAELKGGLTYTREELAAFLQGQGHPYPGRRLTLWIQNTPAQNNDRYAQRGESSKCRYKHCPAKGNTIMKGFFRVAFDEFSDQTGPTRDPFHNAGYMHLHCFEKVFDLGYLIHYGAARFNFRILPDTRDLVHESRNPAAINRDHAEMMTAYNDWVEGQRARADRIERTNPLRKPRPLYTGLNPTWRTTLSHEKRLGCVLTDKHLSLQIRNRQATRESRGGAHIGVHRGDLDLYVHLHTRRAQGIPVEQALAELASQAAGQSAGAAAPSLTQGKKRNRNEDHDDESNDESSNSRYSKRIKDGEREGAATAFSAPKRPRPRHLEFKNHGQAGPVPQQIFSATSRNLTFPAYGNLVDDPGHWRLPPPSKFPTPAAAQTPAQTPGVGAGAQQIPGQRTAAQPHSHPPRASVNVITARVGNRHYQSQMLAQVLSAVPDRYAHMVLPPAGVVHDDRLAERITRLGQRERVEVDRFVRKLEERQDLDTKRRASF
ncbi:hypothetical protein C7999DRAFT_12544 [Corynascus novoguineensis]|uniref:Uncharacterized protein n=1 Tax=Corynascus novoguineensis TaxID=1126955 RepID=A0AAN7HRS1_9PEZI|nr:hypothetical protein C7999DRAFT_12544 [Corynascus novoguineensis]